MKPKQLVFEEVWGKNLRDTVRQLMTGHVPRNQWHDGYGDVYDLCVAKPEPLSEVLYETTEKYLRDHVESLHKEVLERAEKVGLLAAYSEYWQKYSTGAGYLNSLYLFLNLEYVKKKRIQHSDLLYNPPSHNERPLEIGQMALDIWMKVMITRLKDDLIRLILDVVHEDRTKGAVSDDGRFIKGVVQSFVEVENFHKGTRQLEFYSKFEAEYLRRTNEYYAAISADLVGHTSCSEFMEKILNFVDQENMRSNRFLDASSCRTVLNECEKVMVGKHIDFIYQEAKAMIDQRSEKDLKNMYALLKPLDSSCIHQLIKAVQDKIEADGQQLLRDIDPEDAPHSFVESMLRMYKDHHGFVSEVFKQDRDFMAALDRACTAVINSRHPKINVKAPELLAKYCDQLLRKGSRAVEDSELEDRLTNAIVVFKYLDDKDHFHKSYSKYLAKRLIHSNSASILCEDMMITKLKDSCGYEYTSKLHRMFKDITLSADLSGRFSRHLDDKKINLKIGISVSILQAGAWPMSPTPVSKFITPPEIQTCISHYELFYKQFHSGRVLTWLHNLSNVDLRLNFATSGRSYTMTCSTFMAAIALLFESDDSLTFEHIQTETAIQGEHLTRSLQSLVEAKMLYVDEPESGSSTTTDPSNPDYKESTKFHLNLDFTHKRTKFKITMIPVKELVVLEQEQTAASVEEDRKVYLQALIVRIMKVRKILKHNDLVQQVIAQSTDRFRPNGPLIKKCIESLVGKQYIELMPNSTDEYSYVA